MQFNRAVKTVFDISVEKIRMSVTYCPLCASFIPQASLPPVMKFTIILTGEFGQVFIESSDYNIYFQNAFNCCT